MSFRLVLVALIAASALMTGCSDNKTVEPKVSPDAPQLKRMNQNADGGGGPGKAPAAPKQGSSEN